MYTKAFSVLKLTCHLSLSLNIQSKCQPSFYVAKKVGHYRRRSSGEDIQKKDC
jgi:hypothetical protein